jgi:hypothetical protein
MEGVDIACLPDFIGRQLREGVLVTVLDDYSRCVVPGVKVIELIEPTVSVFFTGGTAGSWVEPSGS